MLNLYGLGIVDFITFDFIRPMTNCVNPLSSMGNAIVREFFPFKYQENGRRKVCTLRRSRAKNHIKITSTLWMEHCRTR